jgi:peptidoglycan hydrolase CwlO-like protein
MIEIGTPTWTVTGIAVICLTLIVLHIYLGYCEEHRKKREEADAEIKRLQHEYQEGVRKVKESNERIKVIEANIARLNEEIKVTETEIKRLEDAETTLGEQL